MDYQYPSQDPRLSLEERLKILYPMVNEEETPLPRAWSTKVMKGVGAKGWGEGEDWRDGSGRSIGNKVRDRKGS